MPDLKQYLPHALVVLSALSGGGAIQYTNTQHNDVQDDTAASQSYLVAELMGQVDDLRKRVNVLEKKP